MSVFATVVATRSAEGAAAHLVHTSGDMNLGEHVDVLTANLSKLIGLHITLARQEAAEDVSAFLSRLVVLLAVAPVALGAFTLLTCAAVLALAPSVSLIGAMVLMGGLYAAVAVVGTLSAAKALRSLSPLNDTAQEIVGTTEVLRHG
ncbi:MAG: phage holin family protein [Archangium sp.]|nr:phage holin family protein [Archangium sp.]